MAVTLAQAQVNIQDDVTFAVIDDTRRRSWLLDQLTFDDCVNPAGGGSTLTYGYTRLVTPAGASFRAFNTEYTPGQAVRQRYTVDLKPLGGSFQVDRALANLGPAATNEEAFQFAEVTKSVKNRFQDAMINGDRDRVLGDDAAGFDGLSKALRGSSTEINPDTSFDWTSATVNTHDLAATALDTLDQLVGLVEGGADAIMGNIQGIQRVRSLARRAGYYTLSRDDFGNNVERFGNAVLVDLGFKGDGTSIIPLSTRDVSGSIWTTTVTGVPTGGTYTLTVAVNGAAAVASGAIAYNATAAVIQAALAAMANVGANNVTVAGTTTDTITFVGALTDVPVVVALGTNSLTGGTTPSVTVTETAPTGGVAGLTDLYAVRFGLDGFHAVSTVGQLVQVYRPNYALPGAVKTGEVEMGPLAGVLKSTRAAAVLRNIKVQ